MGVGEEQDLPKRIERQREITREQCRHTCKHKHRNHPWEGEAPEFACHEGWNRTELKRTQAIYI